MSVVEPGPGASNLVQRVKDILLQPTKTWEVIDGEQATVGGLYRSYVIPLALIPAVCGLIGASAFGHGFGFMGFGVHYRTPIVWAFTSQFITFLLTLGSVYVVALVIDALAPSFGGTRNRMQAFKVAAYAGTASWVAGVFELLPALSVLGILGLYSLYLLYKGLPILMKTPQDKALPYTAVVVVALLVIGIVIGAILGPVMMLGRGPMGMSHRDAGMFGPRHHEVTINTPGGSVDVSDLEEASKRMQAAAEGMKDGKIKAVDPSALQAYLPAAIAGFQRTEISSSSGGVGGMNGSAAEGDYGRGDDHLTLRVVDMGAAGALTAMAGAFNVQSNKETDGSYERFGKVDGRMTVEKYDRSSKHGEYGVFVADRFMVQAEGDGVNIDDLKAAVQAVDFAKLETAAKAG
ncbi:Yip1 family protein [Phenylobacterium sp.]|uniref:Yip1 family protein n=1 Tax=Phenylobacterium sp. TaxID=1871053 RepID=UPI0035AFAB7D